MNIIALLIWTCFHILFSNATSFIFKWKVENIEKFIGTVNKATNIVKISPEIRLITDKDTKLCNLILTSFNGQDLPFVAEIESSSLGLGKMVISGPILLDRYQFTIKAKMCGKETYSSELMVDLQVVTGDVIYWEEHYYKAVVKDNIQPGSEVVRVHAYELGGDVGNSICNYKIQSIPIVPFDVDGNGVIRTSDHLNIKKQKTYEFQITAIDCWVKGARQSSVGVKIEVEHACILGWNGIFKQINYQPNKGVRLLGKEVILETCKSISVTKCQPVDVSVKLRLINADTKRCDMDLASLRHQRLKCGIDYKTQELLPSAEQFTRESLGSGGSADPVTGIFTFDGVRTRWEVPTNIISPGHRLGDNFTISFWMRHTKLEQQDNSIKEQIICNSDGDYKNRHHYSIFLHNCKLILLFRFEEYQTSKSSNQMNLLSPAEWRYMSPEFCDNKWHSYTITMTTGRVKPTDEYVGSTKATLFIDGDKFIKEPNNPEIIDDMPMKHMSQVHFTKLSVGACWHSKSGGYIQHFQGQLSGVTVLRGKIESDSKIECINRCHEQLLLSDIGNMAVGTAISINSGMTQMTITASNIGDVQKIINIIGYTNSRWNPLPGYRRIQIDTDIRCSNDTVKIKVPSVETKVLVLANKVNKMKPNPSIDYPIQLSVDNKIIIIKAQSQLTNSGKGLLLLAKLIVTDTSESGLGSVLLWGKATAEGDVKPYTIDGASLIDSCAFYPIRPLNMQHEWLGFSTINIIEDMMEQGINLTLTNSSHGIVIDGKQSIYVYQFVLRRIVYFNSNLNKSFKRIFNLVCSQKSVKKTSNTLKIKIQLDGKLREMLPDIKETNSPYYFQPYNVSPSSLDHDPSVFQHSQSEGAHIKLNSPNENSSVAKSFNFSNGGIIISVVLLLVVALIIVGLLRLTRYKVNAALLNGHNFKSNKGPWVRLRHNDDQYQPEVTNNRGFFKRILPTLAGITNRSDIDSSENNSNNNDKNKESALQITVNPFSDHDKKVNMFNNYNKTKTSKSKLFGDEFDDEFDYGARSIDEELPDEYEGHSEDFMDEDDDNIDGEEDGDISNDYLSYDECEDDEDDGEDICGVGGDHMRLHMEDTSFTKHNINNSSRSWSFHGNKCKPWSHKPTVNIHQNPRYSLDNGFIK